MEKQMYHFFSEHGVYVYVYVTVYIYIQGWPKKTGLFFRLDNFVTVSPRNPCSMSKFSKFYREKRHKTAFQ